MDLDKSYGNIHLGCHNAYPDNKFWAYPHNNILQNFRIPKILLTFQFLSNICIHIFYLMDKIYIG